MTIDFPLDIIPAPGIELNVPDNLPAISDSAEGLDVLEGAIESSYRNLKAVYETETTIIMWSVSQILERRLWRHRTDEGGRQVYRDEESYLPELIEMLGRGRSSVKKYKAVSRLARGLGYDSLEDIEEAGGSTTFVAVHKEVTMASNGKITGMRNGDPPDGLTATQFVQRTIAEQSAVHNELGTDPKERSVAIRQALRSRNTMIWFTLGKGNGILYHKEITENGDFVGHWAGAMADLDVPEDVFNRYCQLLGIERRENGKE